VRWTGGVFGRMAAWRETGLSPEVDRGFVVVKGCSGSQGVSWRGVVEG